MATNNPRSALSLLGLARQTDPDGSIATIAEVLDEVNPIFVDAPMIKSNKVDAHRITRRTSLPAPTWTKINSGITPTRGDTQQVDEHIGMLEGRSEIDTRLFDLTSDPGKLRANESRPHVEGIGQEFANTFVAGSRTGSPEEFDGLETRYGALDASSDYQTVFDNGETTGSTNTSWWFVQWGETMAHLIYPKNSDTMGISEIPKGEEPVFESGSTTAKFYAWVTVYKLQVGLAVHDVRVIKRIANINSDRSDAQSLNENVVIEAINEMPFNGRGAVGYVNRDVQTQLDIIAKDKTNVYYTPDGPFGRPQMHFRTIPVHRLDAITSTESIIS
jgi:hypothetical protein